MTLVFLSSSSALKLGTGEPHPRLVQGVCHRGRRRDPGALGQDDASLRDPAHGRGGGRQSVSPSRLDLDKSAITKYMKACGHPNGRSRLSCLSCTLRLVFSQSLISLDLIEDFLRLSTQTEDEGKLSPYKGTSSMHRDVTNHHKATDLWSWLSTAVCHDCGFAL